jgi:hypothetical protein
VWTPGAPARTIIIHEAIVDMQSASGSLNAPEWRCRHSAKYMLGHT